MDILNKLKSICLIKDNKDKINRNMTGLEKIFSKSQNNSPFQSNLHKELQPTKNKDRKPKEKIDKGQNRQLPKGSKRCSNSLANNVN